MKKTKKKIQKLFKAFFYKIFILLNGKIKGSLSYNNDNRIKKEIVKKEDIIKYRVFAIKNCRLYTDRIHDMAIILDNYIVDGPSYQLRPINNANIDKNIVFEKGTPRIKKNINGRVFSLLSGGAANENYWHWLFDVLPRFALVEELLDINNLDFFLLPNLEKSFQIETLNLLNISKKKCLSSKFYRHIQCSELFVTDHPYVINNDASHDIQNIPKWIFEWLRKKFIDEKSLNQNLPEKIYIDRSDSTSNVKHLRSIINEQEVQKLMSINGFKSITLGNLTFADQVKIFNKAKIIVGLHGAGFANLCFCNPNTKIVELKSNTAGKMIENLATTNKLDYKSVSSEPTEKNRNQFGHINVSIEELKKII